MLVGIIKVKQERLPSKKNFFGEVKIIFYYRNINIEEINLEDDDEPVIEQEVKKTESSGKEEEGKEDQE